MCATGRTHVVYTIILLLHDLLDGRLAVHILFFPLHSFPFNVGFLCICILAPRVWVDAHEASAKVQNINDIHKLDAKLSFITPQLNFLLYNKA